MGINYHLPIPICTSNLSNEFNISISDRTSEGTRRFIMDAGLLFNLAPSSTLAVEHTNYSRAFIHIPYLEQAAKHNFSH
jgi:hypothetical protein